MTKEQTLNAFLDHGVAEKTLPGDIDNAVKILDDLKKYGIDIDEVNKDLLEAGLEAFVKSFKSLLDSIEKK